MSEKIVLIDGHSILHRAFYGVPELTNAKGLHTNAVYGFLNIMFKILEEEKPDYLAVAFDVHAPTFRHKLYEAYKGTRKPMPEELREQVPVTKQVLTAMGILIMEQAGLEADDILGTMAKRAESAGMEVALVSGDRDLLQIATEHIKIRIPKTKGYGRTEVEDYYARDVQEKYQVTPLQFIELKALMGDASDNIPGVPKVGEKTATELMVQFGSLDNLYAHLEEVKKNSVRTTLAEHRDLAELSRVLAAIHVDSEINYRFEDARLGDWRTKEAYELLTELEFKKLLSQFEKENRTVNRQTASFAYLESREAAEKLFAKAAAAERAGFALLQDPPGEFTAGADGQLELFAGGGGFLALSLTVSEEETGVMIAGKELPAEWLLEKLAGALEHTLACTFDCKTKYGELGVMQTAQTSRFFDTLIAAYLLNPLKNDYRIEDVAGEYLGLHIAGRAEVFGKASYGQAQREKPAEFLEYAGFASYVPALAQPVLLKKLQETGMEKLFREIEMPLSFVLYTMEQEGVRVLPEELKKYGDALVERITQLEQSIHQAAGCDFNINSPKQLGEVLFEKMQLPGGKKTKTGYSTAADVLDKLAPEHEIVADILEYRGLAKLKSTYADGLAAYIGPDQRIHTTLNQTITATGRISSTEPNLQNIPMRMELGRLIRKVFVPKEGCVFTDADYSQIELRVLASLSGDEQLIEAYRMDADIHRITASKVFHTPFDEVTDLQRRNAKAVNFGIVYGISSFGLSQGLSITRKEAALYIEQYFATYPGVKKFLDRTVAQAREKGYVTTVFGRRRPIPELSSSNFMQRSFGERVAMNSPIQGTAADIIKIAMLRVYNALEERGLKSRLILQIHDELLVETAQDETELVKQILEEEMKAAADLAVTLEVDVHTGTDWYEAK